MLPVLPVQQALVGIGPVYQKKFLSFKDSGPYNLRSNASCELKVPKTKCALVGPSLWNTLSKAIRSIQWSGFQAGSKHLLISFGIREKNLYWRLDCCSEGLHSLYSGCLWFIFFMSDKQSAVIYRRVTRRVASQSWRYKTLIFFRSWSMYFSSMYFHVFFVKLSNKLLWLFYLFVIFPMKLHFLVF